MENKYTGKLPDKWKVEKIGGIYKERSKKVSDKKYPPLSVTKQGILPQLVNVAKTNDNDNRKLVKKYDFVINSRSDRRGSCGIAKQDGSVSLINIVLEPIDIKKINNFYYDRLFHTTQFADEFYKWGYGIVDDLWSTKWQDMKRIEVPYPPLKEQKAIVNYLDNKCDQIDDIVKNLENKIEVLSSYKNQLIKKTVLGGLDDNVNKKESGVKWIGKIPEHWRMVPNKFLFKETTKKVGSSWNKYNLLSLTTAGVKEKDINTFGGKLPESYDKYLVIKEGQMIFCLFDLDVSAVFSGLATQSGMITSAYNAYWPTNLINVRYANYYFQFIFINRTYKLYSKNIRYTVTGDVFNSIKTVIPPLEEQKAISDYLDTKCSQIDDILKDTRKEIETLKQYKQSLIYEYVTGKKEVPIND